MATIAFIPARGGSKSIPHKNIKPLNGQPLIYWVCKALEDCKDIDQIIVATDDEQIAQTVNSLAIDKLEVYERSLENATDQASTESVMLEYIDAADHGHSDIFILVQATSPFTTSKHFSEGLNAYKIGSYDSLLSVCRSKRFFWDENGNSLNYDFKNRPRRQDFDGVLMENGAFYINTISSIQTQANRLSGNIGHYIMPDFTALELDEPDDWLIAEQLMLRHGYKA